MSAVVTADIVQLPAPVARRGIAEAQWRTLVNNLYPGAASESVIMVWDYCIARGLDPMKKPCHIVPMRVKDGKSGSYVWRDVVMPGIYEYRATATRTKQYLGHSKPVYGPVVEYLGERVPEWCEITVYRWNNEASQRAEYPVQLRFEECAGTRKDKDSGKYFLNDRWATAPQQMLTKCTEAAALREAFPDELGGTHTAEEMEGVQVIDVTPKADLGPRPDTSNVDSDLVNKWVSSFADILAQDKEEHEIADMLREADADLSKFDALYSVVFDKLASEGVISKAAYRKYLKVKAPGVIQ